jgi:hypothetical protein
LFLVFMAGTRTTFKLICGKFLGHRHRLSRSSGLQLPVHSIKERKNSSNSPSVLACHATGPSLEA